MDVFKLLVGLGLPSAIIAMAAIAYLFKDKYEKVSKASLIIAISLGALLGLYQLVALITGKDVSLLVRQDNFSAITFDGRVQAAQVNVYKGDKLIKSKSFAAFDSTTFSKRPLSLSYADSSRFHIMSGPFAQGQLSFQVLRDIGWRPATVVISRVDAPRYWFTYKVYVGNEFDLGDTGDSGILRLKFLAIKDDRAEIRLILKGRAKPMPRTVGILNKGLSAQDFDGLPTFYIAVREANFAENWAAFSVFQYRGY